MKAGQLRTEETFEPDQDQAQLTCHLNVPVCHLIINQCLLSTISYFIAMYVQRTLNGKKMNIEKGKKNKKKKSQTLFFTSETCAACF